MSFFTQFPKIKYDINADGTKTELTDMFRYVDVKDGLINNVGTYTWYEIIEGERPDVVSNRLYGSPDYYWTFFAVNESLKKGLNTWPKSYRQFELMLEEDYSKYSVLVFVPRQYPAARKYENSFEMINYFGGLDLDTGNIRIRTYDDELDGSKIEAEILRFDDQRFQLWVYNANKPGKFSNNRNWKIEYIDNPYEGGTEYRQFEDQKVEWAKSAFEWTRKNQTSVYYSFLRDTENRQNLITESNAYYNYFLQTYFQKISFVSHRFFQLSYNAPSYFLDNEYEEDRSTAFDAYSKVFSQSDVVLPVNYFRGDVDTNVSGDRLDGFEQSEITEYNSISRQRKYIPSFVESYFAEQAKFVSIKDDLAEKAFEARKIRIIRPEYIDEFVELYKEKLLK
tara:strand:- start:17449 stop:18630 length:1182 start_codon:yes stop_codon:yes gene_type:complete